MASKNTKKIIQHILHYWVYGKDINNLFNDMRKKSIGLFKYTIGGKTKIEYVVKTHTNLDGNLLDIVEMTSNGRISCTYGVPVRFGEFYPNHDGQLTKDKNETTI